MIAFLNLFKAVLIDEDNKNNDPSNEQIFLKRTIKYGCILSKEVIENCSLSTLEEIIKNIEKIFNLNPKQLNSTFHKSWNKIKNTPIENLAIEQLVHYITTYGFEEIGIYHENKVFIPTEKLKIPNINIDKIPLVIIKGYTREEFKEKIFNLLTSGIAFSENTIHDIVDISTFLQIKENEISKIKNKEIRAILYHYLDVIPSDPVEFLRFCIYRSCNKTLLIKDKNTIEKIKYSVDKNIGAINLFNKYSKQYGLKKLSTIFYRFKPIFLSFRTNMEMKKIINRIRRLAISNHIPMKEDYLNSVTLNIKNEKLDLNELKLELDKVNVFRKVRLAYSLKFRLNDPECIMYKIRNGKTFVTDFKEPIYKYDQALELITQSISNDLKEKVFGKKIYIPSTIKYTLPTSEKMFIGNFPSGTCVSIPNKMIFGIHWFDVEKQRIDLDLSLIDSSGEKLGWDGGYRNQNNSILFSGDMTSAPTPNGATELFYVNTSKNLQAIMFVNYYNYNEKIEVPFKIIVGKDNKITKVEKNYMINPNNIISIDQTTINTNQKILGLLSVDENSCNFYYVNSNLTGSISSRENELTIKTRKFLFDYNINNITLNETIVRAGGILVKSKEDCEIDLSPESLEKDTIINLIS